MITLFCIIICALLGYVIYFLILINENIVSMYKLLVKIHNKIQMEDK